MSLTTVQNPPIKLEWAGWHSDSYSLARNGWEIAVHDDPYQQITQFSIGHRELDIFGFTYPMSKRAYIENRKLISEYPFQVYKMTSRLVYHEIGAPMIFNQFDPTDIKQEIVTEYSMQTLPYFKSLNIEKNIIVKPESVQELLSRIQELQEPKQKEIRQRMLKEKLYQTTHANIITLAS